MLLQAAGGLPSLDGVEMKGHTLEMPEGAKGVCAVGFVEVLYAAAVPACGAPSPPWGAENLEEIKSNV